MKYRCYKYGMWYDSIIVSRPYSVNRFRDILDYLILGNIEYYVHKYTGKYILSAKKKREIDKKDLALLEKIRKI